MSEETKDPNTSQENLEASETPAVTSKLPEKEPLIIRDTSLKNEKKMPPKIKAATPQWVFNILWSIMELGSLLLLGILFVLVYLNLGWPGVWKITLIGTCGLFSIMSLLVIIGGALDVRKLFSRLREQENNIIDSKASD